MLSPRRTVLVLALLAGAVQWLFILESHRDPAFQFPLIDAAAYHHQALDLAAGRGAPPRAFWQPPLYPYALSLVYRLGLTDLFAARCAHALLDVGAVLLTWAIARRCGGPRWAFAAGLGVCVYGPLVFYGSQLLPTGLAVVLTLAALLLLLRLTERPTWPRALALGVATGAATVTVPDGIVILPLALGWILLVPSTAGAVHPLQGVRSPPCTSVPAENSEHRSEAGLTSRMSLPQPWAGRGALAGAVLAGVLLMVAPVTIRNALVAGEFIPLSTNGGLNLFIGNNPDSGETLTVRPDLDWGRLVALPYRVGAKTDGEADRFFRKQVADYARQHPRAFLRGLCVKGWQALGSREIPRNLDLYVMAGHSRVLGLLVWTRGPFGFPFGLVGPLALLGAFILMRQPGPGRLVVLFMALYFLAVVLVFPASRYLAPLMPACVVSAVAGGAWLLKGAALTRARRLATGGGLILCGLLVNWPRVLPTDAVNYAAELPVNVGAAFQARGQKAEAVREYREAIRLQPDYAHAHWYLGTAYREQGNKAGAIAEFERAIALRIDHDRALNDLAVLRFEQGRMAESVELLNRVLDLDPGNRQAMANLAVGLYRLNRRAEAAEWLRKSKEGR